LVLQKAASIMEAINDKNGMGSWIQSPLVEFRQSRLTAGMAFLVAVLALYASLRGLLDQQLYLQATSAGVFAKTLLAATHLQDQLAIPFAALLLILSVKYLLHQEVKTFIFMLGLVSNFLYTYGLFVITGNFTSIYLVYMGIFGLAIYCLLLGLTSFKPDSISQIQLPVWLARSIALFLGIIVCLFIPLWISALLPLTRQHSRPDIYAVFVLDLCVVLPALAITAFQLGRHRPFSFILAGVVLVKIVTLLLPVALGELLLPTHTQAADYGMALLYGLIVFLSLLLSGLYLMYLQGLMPTKTQASVRV
jgi:hypothetical protein